MKVLLAGEFLWPWYQEACASALERLGVEVVRFSWLSRFRRWVPDQVEPVYRSFAHRVQYRVLDGPTVRAINRDFLACVAATRPDVVWLYNVQLLHPATLATLRRTAPGTVLAQYANDNPFSPLSRKSMWRHFVAGISQIDVHHAYRHGNIRDLKAHGARRIHLMRAYFDPEVDRPMPPEAIDDRFRADVVFAGHYEPDGRVAALEAVCRAGHSLNLVGGGWDAALPHLAHDSPLRRLYPIRPAVSNDYRQAICGARVALCFLSTLNQDTYTRRSFQIPAMKTAMVSQRTSDLKTLFTDGVDAAFFSTPDELLDQLARLLADDTARLRMAESGYVRVHRDGHDVTSRMRSWLRDIAVDA